MQNTKERTQVVREKQQKKKRITKHREKRYTKDEKAMNNLLNIAKAIIYS